MTTDQRSTIVTLAHRGYTPPRLRHSAGGIIVAWVTRKFGTGIMPLSIYPNGQYVYQPNGSRSNRRKHVASWQN